MCAFLWEGLSTIPKFLAKGLNIKIDNRVTEKGIKNVIIKLGIIKKNLPFL